jgi:hypothetical protein
LISIATVLLITIHGILVQFYLSGSADVLTLLIVTLGVHGGFASHTYKEWHVSEAGEMMGKGNMGNRDGPGHDHGYKTDWGGAWITGAGGEPRA